MAACRNCGNHAREWCAGCASAPSYEGDENNVFYCSRDCQRAHRLKHKLYCKSRQNRKMLLRVATLLRKTVSAYLESVFNSSLQDIELWNNNLNLQKEESNYPARADHTTLPTSVAGNIEIKEIAPALAQCTLPLVQRLLSGKGRYSNNHIYKFTHAYRSRSHHHSHPPDHWEVCNLEQI
jgi:MYND finger